MEYYTITLLVYFFTDLLACWGLNLEYGVAGVANLGYIIVVAAGGYTYAVLTLGPSSAHTGFQSYILGLHWSPAFAVLIAMAVGGALGTLLGLSGIRRVRRDYQALVMLVAVVLAGTVVSAIPSLFNGDLGLSLVPNVVSPGWVYVAVVAGCALCGWLVVRKFSSGPYGRMLRAVRDNELAALSIGKNVVGSRLVVQGVGGALGGLSGALLVGFIGAWSTSAWQYLETIGFLTAIIIGGQASDGGVLLGTALVPVLLIQGVQFLPQVPGQPNLEAALATILYSLVAIAFLFFRPQGLVPERRRRLGLRVGTGNRGGTSEGLEVESGESIRRGLERTVAGSRPFPVVGSPAKTVEQIALSVVDVCRSYGGVRAVDNVSFQITAGSITGVIGPNGAGKSTLVALLAGATTPDSGQIRLLGKDVTKVPTHRRARLGLVRSFQLTREFGRLTTLENLVVAAPHHRGERLVGLLLGKRLWRDDEVSLAARGYEMLSYFGMEHQADVRAGELSGGQKRILEFLRAVMTQPRVLLLDEPLAGMSPLVADRFMDACESLRRGGMTILLIEHDLAAIERLCDRVVVMAQGRVLGEGQMSELRLDAAVQDAYLIG